MPSSETTPDVAAALAAAEARCIEAGERWTVASSRVLQLLLEAGQPMRAYELASSFAPGSYTHPPTVYRALEFLSVQGLAHHLETRNRYVACGMPGQRHDAGFLICDTCERVDEVILASPINVPFAADTEEFVVWSWVVELRGLCSSCADGSQ